MTDVVIGLDIGGTSLKSAILTDAGEILHRANTPVEPTAPNWIDAIRLQVAELESRFGRGGRIGVAAPGIARPDGRSIWWMQGRLAQLENLDWTTFLNRDQSVPVLNDAQAALLGEVWLGAAAGETNVVLLTLGTGVGGAAMVDGRLLRGAIGRAGHFGHISLDPDGPIDITNCPGSLENAIGNCTVASRTNSGFTSTLELASAARSGDPFARQVWGKSVRALAAGIASIVNVLDPQTVIIGGGIAAADEALFVPLAAELSRFEWRPHGHQVKIVRAALGEYAGAIGAARNAL